LYGFEIKSEKFVIKKQHLAMACMVMGSLTSEIRARRLVVGLGK